MQPLLDHPSMMPALGETAEVLNAGFIISTDAMATFLLAPSRMNSAVSKVDHNTVCQWALCTAAAASTAVCVIPIVESGGIHHWQVLPSRPCPADWRACGRIT